MHSAVQRPHSGFGDVELFRTVYEKAAALAHGITTGHPFVDGNKRTALLAAAATLRINGLDLEATEEEAEEVMLDLACGRVSVGEFTDWLEQRAVPRAE